jgi:hypothetical protein
MKSFPFNSVFNSRKEKLPTKSGELWHMRRGDGEGIDLSNSFCEIGILTMNAVSVCMCACAFVQVCVCAHACVQAL